MAFADNKKQLVGDSWWLNQPIWKHMLVKLDHLPHPIGVSMKNSWNHHCTQTKQGKHRL